MKFLITGLDLVAEKIKIQLAILRNPEPVNFSPVWLSFYVVSVTIFVAFSMHLPLSLYTVAGHDDGLFLKNAHHIFNGDWLGVYDRLTLAKGPAYSIFLAANAVLGLPVTLSVALLYAFACAVFIRVLAMGKAHKALLFGLFLILLFQPALFPTRLLRENIYHSLSLLVLAGVIFIGRQQQRHYVVVLLFGIVFGFFWITREEGIWILPGCMLYLGYALAARWQASDSRRLMLVHAAIYCLAAAIAPLMVCTLNYVKYGSFELVDFKSQPFVNVLNRLNNISAGPELPFVPVSRAKREAIYRVSPAFAELEDYFENKGQAWKQAGCQINPATCGEYTGGLFMWALRDAVAQKGYYSSAAQAKEYYIRLLAEVDIACETARLLCNAGLLPFLPSIPTESLNLIPQAVNKTIQFSTYQQGAPLTEGSSTGSIDSLYKERLFLGNPNTVPSDVEQTVLLSGWYYAPDQAWIELECQSAGQYVSTAITRLDSPDISQHFKDQNAVRQRFSLVVNNADTCLISGQNQRSDSISIADAMQLKSAITNLGGGTLFFDNRFKSQHAHDRPLHLKYLLGMLYLKTAPVIISVGLLCFVSCIFFAVLRRRLPGELFWLVSMLWMLYITRAILVILIDISAFPAVGYLYLGASLPVLYAASLLSVQLCLISPRTSRV